MKKTALLFHLKKLILPVQIPQLWEGLLCQISHNQGIDNGQMPRVTWVRMLKLWIDWDFICYKTSSLWGPFLWNHLHCLIRALVIWYCLSLICHNLLPTLFVTEQLFSLRGRCSWTILHHLFLKSVSQFTHFQNVAYIFRVCNWESVSTLTYLNYCWGCRFLVNLFLFGGSFSLHTIISWCQSP